MKTIMKTLLFFCMACSACIAGDPGNRNRVALAYVTSWSSIIPDPAYVTHVNYAFGHVNSTFNGVRINNEERLRMIAGLKQQKPSLKVLLSIGGWGSGRFSEMAADSVLRKAFATDCQRVVQQFALDGIDIDWEFPTSSMAKISASPDDTRNFTLLMADIRKAIGNDRLLTLASNASAKYIDFNAVNRYVDFVNIMTYDMASPPKHHAALYRSEHTGWSCGEESVNAHVEAGIPPEKLTLGIPFYGHGKSGIANFIDYRDIIRLEGYTDNWDDTAKAPYLTNASGEYVCTYENVRSIGIKCRYLLDRKMLGAMYWDYDGDDADGSLRKAVYNGVMENDE
jgi:chitinase